MERLVKESQSGQTILQKEERNRRSFIASLVHDKYRNPAFNIYRQVPDITEKELVFFESQYQLMMKDYRSE